MAFDHRLPPDVTPRARSPLPEQDPTLGEEVGRAAADPAGPPLHRLVTIGDSLTHGFKSLAVADTSLSWPKLLADQLGFDFRVPAFDGPLDCPGLPLNLEAMLRALEAKRGRLVALELPLAVPEFLELMKSVDDYWDTGLGFATPKQDDFNHNLAIYGWDLRDAMSKDRGLLRQQILARPPRVNFFRPGVQDNGEISALRVLAGPDGDAVTQLSAAQSLGADVDNGKSGIETLVVMLGANNVLPSVVTLGAPVWSTDEGFQDPIAKSAFTVWRPIHFAEEYGLLVEQLKRVHARHVVLATVPHVTICPLAHGVGARPAGSRYYPYYTRPWITDAEFDPGRDKYLSGDDAWAIDSAIDDYNDTIKDHVRAARRAGLDWYLFDMSGLLDGLAYRRYLADPSAEPEGFQPYKLPAPLAALNPPPDTRFFVSDNGIRSQGGLIALDGIHPTTIGYAIVASEILHILRLAGIPEAQNTDIDFAGVLAKDTLLSKPPLSLSVDLRVLGWFQELTDWASALFRR